MRKTGVKSFILVGLERVPRFEEALLLEFGRGFRYTRPLRLNTMDLDYELMEELVRDDQTESLCKTYFTCLLNSFFCLFYFYTGQYCREGVLWSTM